MMDPNVIHDNRWRCDHGWDIDLDDGSSFYRIYNNLLLNGGLKLREGYGRIASNNIIINNSLNPHDWYLNSGDQFKHNIVCTAYLPAIMDHTIPANGKWGAKLDSNFFVCDDEQMHRFVSRQTRCGLPSGRVRQRRRRHAAHSSATDIEPCPPAGSVLQVRPGLPRAALATTRARAAALRCARRPDPTPTR